jgi:hypothetical protein
MVIPGVHHPAEEEDCSCHRVADEEHERPVHHHDLPWKT